MSGKELLLFSDRAIVVVSNSIAGEVQFNWHRSGYTNMRQMPCLTKAAGGECSL